MKTSVLQLTQWIGNGETVFQDLLISVHTCGSLETGHLQLRSWTNSFMHMVLNSMEEHVYMHGLPW